MQIAARIRRGTGAEFRALFAGVISAVIIAGLAACTSTSHASGASTSTTPSGTSTSSGGAGLPASTSAGSTPAGSVGSLSPLCTKLRVAGQNIEQAQVKLYTSGGGDSAAVAALVSELHDLENGSPAQIKAALADLATGFQSAQALLANPSSASGPQLAAISSKLASDAQKISAYVASTC